MLDRVCDREPEVLDAASTRCGDELGEHIAECASCRDLFDAASAVIDDRRTLMRDARIPSSGLVWWRTQMRARQEAARIAVRTATFVQVALLVVAIIVAFALIGPKLPARELLTTIMTSFGSLAVPVLALVGTWLILAPVALYFAVTED